MKITCGYCNTSLPPFAHTYERRQKKSRALRARLKELKLLADILFTTLDTLHLSDDTVFDTTFAQQVIQG